MKTFNMNSTVRLKLNAKGLEIINSLDKDIRDYEVSLLTDDGYCEMPLLSAIQYFGGFTILHNPIDMIIEIYEKDLTEETPTSL